MGAAGTKLRRAQGDVRKMLMHWCPGCDEPHGITIEGVGCPVWTFNGDYEKPSFNPSILCFTTHEGGKQLAERRTLCHYFIKTGAELGDRILLGLPALDPGKSYIDFCGDSPHALAGRTVELPDWPYARGEYGGIVE